MGGIQARSSHPDHGSVAQSVERGTENPCVTGSIPVLSTRAYGPLRRHLLTGKGNRPLKPEMRVQAPLALPSNGRIV